MTEIGKDKKVIQDVSEGIAKATQRMLNSYHSELILNAKNTEERTKHLTNFAGLLATAVSSSTASILLKEVDIRSLQLN